MIQLPPDFSEFLKLLNVHGVKYLLIGGYAVAYYGYPRATADMDVWIAIDPTNAEKMCEAVRAFGMSGAMLKADLFLEQDKIVRMGVPPLRLEILTTISGVTFDEAYAARQSVQIAGTPVSLISKEHLIQNKRASARHKDLADVEQLSS
ncbi:MAG: nucleotidyltransferase [Deltaproteobacteria bacterium]|nr:nucleotidyltransferase [Deltaproteobacteria bacterium]